MFSNKKWDSGASTANLQEVAAPHCSIYFADLHGVLVASVAKFGNMALVVIMRRILLVFVFWTTSTALKHRFTHKVAYFGQNMATNDTNTM